MGLPGDFPLGGVQICALELPFPCRGWGGNWRPPPLGCQSQACAEQAELCMRDFGMGPRWGAAGQPGSVGDSRDGEGEVVQSLLQPGDRGLAKPGLATRRFC